MSGYGQLYSESSSRSPHTQSLPRFRQLPVWKLEDVGRFANHLLIGLSTRDDPNGEISRFLSSCPNVCDLALWSSADCFKGLLPLIQNLPLIRLATALGSLAPDVFLVPAFSNLTHLDIRDNNNSGWNSDKWNMLTRLPALSHLLIGFMVGTDVIHQLLVQCGELQVLIIAVAWVYFLVTNNSPKLFDEIGDERLVLMVRNEFHESVRDWENGASGRVDSWTIARLFSLARRRKFLNDCSQKWISTSFDLEHELNANGKEWYATISTNGIVSEIL